MFKSLLTLFVYAAEAYKRWQRKREQEEYEKKISNVEKDPANFFDQHFNGDGHSVRNDTDLPDNAADASKTDSAKLDNK